jgi:hypothetical protein
LGRAHRSSVGARSRCLSRMRVVVWAFACVVLAGCEKDAPLLAACQTSIQRGQSLLAVPDLPAAHDWLTQAKNQCGKTPPPELARFEEAIAVTERTQAEAAEKKRRELEPKPASESLVPKVIAIVAKYRDKKGREKCDKDDDRCATSEYIDQQAVQLWTVRGKPDAFLAFTTLPKELATCDQVGPNQVKRTYQDGAKTYCAVTDGPLKGLYALVAQKRSRPETDVTIFSSKAIDADETLAAELATGSQEVTPQ